MKAHELWRLLVGQALDVVKVFFEVFGMEDLVFRLRLACKEVFFLLIGVARVEVL
jgi:hypothetical protein